VTELGGSIDESQSDLFLGSSGGSLVDLVSENEWSGLGTDATSLDHNVVVVNDTVMWESSQWGNVLFSQIVFGGSVVQNTFIGGLTDSVDFLSWFSSVVITELTCSGDSPSGSFWMPGTNATNSSVTSMGLSWQQSGSPSLGNTSGSVTLGDSDNIDNLVHLENIVNSDILFQPLLSVGDLVSGGSTVNLDFDDVSSLGLQVLQQVWLSMDNKSDYGTVLLHTGDLGVEVFIRVLFDVLAESLLLGSIPVLVESSLENIRELG